MVKQITTSLFVACEFLESLIKGKGSDLIAHVVQIHTDEAVLEFDTQSVRLAKFAAADHECAIQEHLDQYAVLLVLEISHAAAVDPLFVGPLSELRCAIEESGALLNDRIVFKDELKVSVLCFLKQFGGLLTYLLWRLL